MEKEQKKAIENYIQSYNSFDVDGMLSGMTDEVVFENISGGQVDMKLEGLDAFRKQAEAATGYFRERKQKITSWDFKENQVVIEIEYQGILAIELPNGMQPGDTLQMKGKSTFHFEGDKIAKVVDES